MMICHDRLISTVSVFYLGEISRGDLQKLDGAKYIRFVYYGNMVYKYSFVFYRTIYIKN